MTCSDYRACRRHLGAAAGRRRESTGDTGSSVLSRSPARGRLTPRRELATVGPGELQGGDVHPGDGAPRGDQSAHGRQQAVVADEGRNGRGRTVAVVVGELQGLHRPRGIDRGLEHRRIEPAVGPPAPGGASGNATTVRPERNRAATVSTTSGRPRRLSRSIGMIRISRASAPMPGQPIRSARATNVPGDTAPMTKTSSQDTCGLTTSMPRRLRTGPPVVRTRTPKQRSTSRQQPRCSRTRPGIGTASSGSSGASSTIIASLRATTGGNARAPRPARSRGCRPCGVPRR